MWRILRSAVAGCMPLAVAAGSVSLFSIDAMAAEISLFTTQEDFTGWDGGTNITATPTATSLDASTINGLGNHTSPGAAGTNGGLLVDWNSGGWLMFTAQDPASRANFLAALGTTDPGAGNGGYTAASGTIKFDYTKPTTLTGNYFQLGIFFNYDGGWGPTTGSETDNGNGTFTATIPYTINATGSSWYFQFGLHYNSNFDPSDTFVIDNVRVVQVPEPASLGLLSIGAIALIRRRRA